jgi:dipeptidyl aminopeptidase/acylaminoacyl peptidase
MLKRIACCLLPMLTTLSIFISTTHAVDVPPLQLAYLHSSYNLIYCDKALIGNIFGDIKQEFDLPDTSLCMPPVWSPDGNYLAVWSPSMVLINLQTQTTQVFDDKTDWWVDSPVWSRDGAYLAWREHKGGVDKNQRWKLLHIQDGEIETLSDISDAKISPDEIRFVQYRDEAFYLVQSGQPVNKLTLPTSVKSCQPADLGQCITDDEIIRFDSEGNNQIFRLTHRPDIVEGSPQWSPDNQHIVYQALNIKTSKQWLEIVAIEASNWYQITNPDDGGWDVQPQWSPDGAYIAFQRHSGYKGHDAKVYVIKSEGSDLQYVGDGVYPAWRPINQHSL